MIDYISSFFFGADARWHIREVTNNSYEIYRYGVYKRSIFGVKSITGLSYGEVYAKLDELTKKKQVLPGHRI